MTLISPKYPEIKIILSNHLNSRFSLLCAVEEAMASAGVPYTEIFEFVTVTNGLSWLKLVEECSKWVTLVG